MRFSAVYIGLLLLVSSLMSGSLSAQYSFLVAGHAYGAHTGINAGLHPPLYEALKEMPSSEDPSFILLTGDFVRNGTLQQFEAIERELDSLSLFPYYVMGNHDNTTVGRAFFTSRYGRTHYHFYEGADLFVVLDQERSYRSISDDQLLYLDSVLSVSEATNVFVSFHMLLWNGAEKYQHVLSNLGSRYSLMSPYSNYWTKLFPILLKNNHQQIYVLTGDVGGRPDAISAFYDGCGHVHMIATGMGETLDENYLLVEVNEAEVTFTLKPLNDGVVMGDLRTSYNYFPSVHSELWSSDSICVEGDFQLVAVANNKYAQWWELEGVGLVSANPEYQSDVKGLYSWISTDSTCVAKQDVRVMYGPDEAPVIRWEGDSLFADSPWIGEWYYENNATGLTGKGLKVIGEGDYQYILRDGKCNRESNVISVLSTSLFEAEDKSIYRCYYDGQDLQIEGALSANDLVQVLDLSGRLLQTYRAVMPGEGPHVLPGVNRSGSARIVVVSSQSGRFSYLLPPAGF